MTKKQRIMLVRILISAAMTVALLFVPASGIVKLCLYLVPYLLIGYDILWSAAKRIVSGYVFDENFLMAIATIGALVLAALRTGDYTEAVAVMLFYQTGELFQSYAVGKSRRNIAALMDIRPDYANLVIDGEAEEVDPDEVTVGSAIIVRPGERIPIDGIVISGHSAVNSAALTGESLPRDVKEGDEVISGCINLSGEITVRTTKEFAESTVSKILELVENASSRKSRPEQFISQFAKVYTPIVCGAAVVLAAVPPLIQWLFCGNTDIMNWIYRALTFLVISCPCALVVSIPLTFFAGLGRASADGILIKGSHFFEPLTRVKTVVFDKTGTLTKGAFSVVDRQAATGTTSYLLMMAAYAESASSHPIAKSILDAYGRPIERDRLGQITETAGRGVTAEVDGETVVCGNEAMMKELGIVTPAVTTVGTHVFVAVNGRYRGCLTIADTVKDSAAEAIRSLKALGVTKAVMLTGDNETTANAVAEKVGIDETYAELLPADKVANVERLLDSGEIVLFAGDGINDAPVLSRADIGVAMGSLGSDAAVEAADVVLMNDDPASIVNAVRLARRAMAIVKQNIVLAIGIKGICLLLGAFGIANLWLAVFADVGVMVIAVLNAVRMLIKRT